MACQGMIIHSISYWLLTMYKVLCYRTWGIQWRTKQMWHLSDKACIRARKTQHETTFYINIYFYLGTECLKITEERIWPNMNKLLTGTRKAKVLPDPVLAAPRTSLPCKANPMVCFCISVTKRYWASCKPASVKGIRMTLQKIPIEQYYGLNCVPFIHVHVHTHTRTLRP